MEQFVSQDPRSYSLPLGRYNVTYSNVDEVRKIPSSPPQPQIRIKI